MTIKVTFPPQKKQKQKKQEASARIISVQIFKKGSAR